MMGLFDDLKSFFKTETVRLHPETIRQLSAGRAEYRPKGVLTFEPARGTRHPEIETPLKWHTLQRIAAATSAQSLLEPQDPSKFILAIASVVVSIFDVGVPAAGASLLGVGPAQEIAPGAGIYIFNDIFGRAPAALGVYTLYPPGRIYVLPYDRPIMIENHGGGESYVVSIGYYEIEKG